MYVSPLHRFKGIYKKRAKPSYRTIDNPILFHLCHPKEITSLLLCRLFLVNCFFLAVKLGGN